MRLAASILLILIPGMAPYMAAYGSPGFRVAAWGDAVILLAWVLLAGTYALARSRHGRVAVWLVVGIPWLAIAVNLALADPSVDLVYYTVIPVLLAAILLDARPAAVLAVLNLLGVAAYVLNPPPGSPVAFDGGVVTYVLFLATVSALGILASTLLERSAREAEGATERLREADRFRLQLLNAVAHDLAAPLTPTTLQLDLLKRGADPQKAFTIIERNMRHMARLVGDVKDLAKIEAGRLALDRRRVDVAALARDAVEAFREAARAKEVDLVPAAEGPLEADADPDRLNQVLFNLITNAVKFTPPGGVVRVAVEANDGRARVSVQDTGRGLAPDEVPRLFQAFSQVHDRSEVKEKGTGLGLFISKGIVEGHGGRIWVESGGRGHGSTFRFEVPRAGEGT